MIGKTLAHYEIVEKIGAGGMGAVYRARDTRLGREVALKLLPPETLADPGARARMQREARTASALNHPHICTVYEVGEADGQVYIAMELVRGRPLDESIPAGGLPPASVLRYGAQIADALAHAHAQGVIHRDLKTSNVVITEDGRPKVLDFGLARRTEAASDGGAPLSMATLTEPGAVAGTPHALAPELLLGEKADARSDLWAFGVLLHEMAAGELPFGGRTGIELSAAILHQPAASLPERVPPGLRALIGRCLEKERSRRHQSAAEMRAALEALQSDASAKLPWRAPARRWAMAASIAVGVVVTVFLTLRWRSQVPRWQREPSQQQLTSVPEGVGGGLLSPDGKYLAYGDPAGLHLRLIATGDVHSLILPPGFMAGPFGMVGVDWFPDGTRLLLSGADGDGTPWIWEVPIAGGSARKLMAGGAAAVISRDGSRIAFARPSPSGPEIWCMGADGQGARRIATSDSTGQIAGFAAWSPTGDRLAYARLIPGAPGGEQGLESCDLQGRSRVFLADSLARRLHPLTIMRWAPDGRVVFALFDQLSAMSNMNLWTLHVDPHSGKPSGPARQITHWNRTSFLEPLGITADGRRLTVNLLQYQSDVYVGELGARDSALRGVRRLTLDDRFDLYPAWTLDSRALVFTSDRNGSMDVFRQGLDQSVAEPLVTAPGDQIAPRMSPDGKWILYWDLGPEGYHLPKARSVLMRLLAGGGGAETVLVASSGSGFRCASPPATICLLREDMAGRATFTAFDPERGRGRELAHVEAGSLRAWDISPDGEQIVLAGPEDSIPQLRIVPIGGGTNRLIRLRESIAPVYVAWAAHGDEWFVVGTMGGGWRLLRTDHTGRCTRMIPTAGWMYSHAASPDGRHVAFTSNTVQANLWMLEDF